MNKLVHNLAFELGFGPRASPGIRFNEHIEGDGPTVFAHACRLGLEGVSLDVELPLAGRCANVCIEMEEQAMSLIRTDMRCPRVGGFWVGCSPHF